MPRHRPFAEIDRARNAALAALKAALSRFSRIFRCLKAVEEHHDSLIAPADRAKARQSVLFFEGYLSDAREYVLRVASRCTSLGVGHAAGDMITCCPEMGESLRRGSRRTA